MNFPLSHSCPFLGPGSNPGLYFTFSCHASESPSNCDIFSVFPVFYDLDILKECQLLYRIPSVGLCRWFLMIRFRLCTFGQNILCVMCALQRASCQDKPHFLFWKKVDIWGYQEALGNDHKAILRCLYFLLKQKFSIVTATLALRYTDN